MSTVPTPVPPLSTHSHLERTRVLCNVLECLVEAHLCDLRPVFLDMGQVGAVQQVREVRQGQPVRLTHARHTTAHIAQPST